MSTTPAAFAEDLPRSSDPSKPRQPVVGDPSALLRDRFGLSGFREGQAAVIERLLAGKNAAAVFPTGGGKSLCYQLPALMLPGTTVVVSPLIALMKDQCDALAAKGIAAARLDSSLSTGEVRDMMRGIREGSTKILYVAPERFFNERFLATLGTLDVSLFAIDEAHCISQWGHNFRPDYLKLAELSRDLDADRVLALTATATPDVLEDICEAFAIESQDAIRTKFFRPNLQLLCQTVDSANQVPTLIERIQSRPRGSTLVYVTLQRTAEEVAESLAAAGLPARAYHAGMDDEKRAEVQQMFLASDDAIVVATIAFGMGIDKANLRYVYHFNPSKSIESYAQEIGRAGRDGDDSICETLLLPDDRIVLENFVHGDTPSRHAVHFLIERLAGQPETFHVSHYKLSSECDIRILVLRTLLTYLELDGYLRATSPRYDTYKIKPLVTSAAILKHFDGEPRQFLASLLGCLTKGRKLFLLNVPVACQRLGTTRERVLRAIDHLVERGWIEVQVSDLVHGYRVLRKITDPKTLADAYHGRLLRREETEIERIDAVFDLLIGSECLAARLSAHFGERLAEPCGRCSHCRQESVGELPVSPSRSIGNSAEKMLRDVVVAYPDRFVTARDRARFLCGLSSPAFIRQKISRQPGYGVCDRIPFRDVKSQVGGEDDVPSGA